MDINLNINAPELCGALNNIANALIVTAEQSAPVRKTRASKVVEVAAVVADPVLEVAVIEPEIAVNVVPVVDETIEEALIGMAEVQFATNEVNPVPAFSLEDVRAKLAALSATGHKAKIKELFAKFGAKKLTEVPTENYAELMFAVEAIV